MDDYCKQCGYAVGDLSPTQVGERLTSRMMMYEWEDCAVGFETNVPGLGDVQIAYNSYLTADDNEGIRLVWKTRFGHISITGYYSSYTGCMWNMDFAKAEMKIKEVVYFE